MLENITPLILTYNEEPNITRTLNRLSWANSIIVIDSFSDDDTVSLCQQYPQVEVFQRTFDTMAQQWNFGLSKVSGNWVLSLDADYLVTDELRDELSRLPNEPKFRSYYIPLTYCIFGKPLAASILPPRCALFDKTQAEYIDDGHTQLLQPRDPTGSLSSPIYHDDRKSLARWLASQEKYASLEAQKLLTPPSHDICLADRIRKMILVAPFLVFFYCLFVKGGIRDGWRGVYYALQRFTAEAILSLKLIHHKIGP